MQFRGAPFQIEVVTALSQRDISKGQEVSGENLGQGPVPAVPALLGSCGWAFWAWANDTWAASRFHTHRRVRGHGTRAQAERPPRDHLQQTKFLTLPEYV